MRTGAQTVNDLQNLIAADKAVSSIIGDDIRRVEEQYLDLAKLIDPSATKEAISELFQNLGGTQASTASVIDLMFHLSDVASIAGVPFGLTVFKPSIATNASHSHVYLNGIDYFGYSSLKPSGEFGNTVSEQLIGATVSNPTGFINLVQSNFRSIFSRGAKNGDAISAPYSQGMSQLATAANATVSAGTTTTYSFGASLSIGAKPIKVSVEQKGTEDKESIDLKSTLEVEKGGGLDVDLKVSVSVEKNYSEKKKDTQEEDNPTGDKDDTKPENENEKPQNGNGKDTGGNAGGEAGSSAGVDDGGPVPGDPGTSPSGPNNPLINPGLRTSGALIGIRFSSDILRISMDILRGFDDKGADPAIAKLPTNAILAFADPNLRPQLEGFLQQESLLDLGVEDFEYSLETMLGK